MSFYGAIDEGMVARKYEETAFYEDRSLVDDMHRETLMDFRPDQASLESDQARRDYQSTSRIRLRESGSRGDDPEHPEIFIGFTDRDPRGIMTDPDYKELTKQAWSRRRFIEAKMYNDDDNSVPSQGIRPEKMQYMIKHSYPEFKKRFKNYSTSKEALKPGMHPVSTRVGSEVDKLYAKSERMDNLIPDGVEFRKGKTTEMSNNINIGWWRTTDHEFKVAQYGKLYKMPGRQNEGISRDVRYEAEFGASSQWKPSKPMVMLMAGAVSNKQDKHVQGDMQYQTGLDHMSRKNTTPQQITELLYQALNEAQFSESYDPKTGKHKYQNKDMGKIREFVKATQKLPLHTQIAIKEEIERFVNKNPTVHDIHPDRSKVVINPKILEFMDGHVRKTGKNTTDKNGVRRQDDIAAGDPTIQVHINGPTVNGMELFVTKRNHGYADNPSRNALAVVKGESKKTYSYRNAKPDVFGSVQDQATIDIMLKSSALSLKRAELMQARDMTTIRGNAEGDNQFGENRSLTRHGRAMGNKYMTRSMETDHNETDLNDLM